MPEGPDGMWLPDEPDAETAADIRREAQRGGLSLYAEAVGNPFAADPSGPGAVVTTLYRLVYPDEDGCFRPAGAEAVVHFYLDPDAAISDADDMSGDDLEVVETVSEAFEGNIVSQYAVVDRLTVHPSMRGARLGWHLMYRLARSLPAFSLLALCANPTERVHRGRDKEALRQRLVAYYRRMGFRQVTDKPPVILAGWAREDIRRPPCVLAWHAGHGRSVRCLTRRRRAEIRRIRAVFGRVDI